MAVRDNLGGGLNIENPTRITTWSAKTDMKKNTIVEAVSDGTSFGNSLTSQTLTGYLYTPVRNVSAYHPYMYRHYRDTTDLTKLIIEYGYLDSDCVFHVTASSVIENAHASSSGGYITPKLYKLYGNYYVYTYSKTTAVFEVMILQENTSTHTFTAVSTLTELSRYNYESYGSSTLLSASYVSYASNVLTFVLQVLCTTSSSFLYYYQYTFTYNTSTKVLAWSSVVTDTKDTSSSTYVSSYTDFDGTLYNVVWNASNCSLHVMKGSGGTHHNNLITLTSSGSNAPSLSMKSRFMNGFLYAYTTSSRSYFSAGGFSYTAGGSAPVVYPYSTDAAINASMAGTNNRYEARMSSSSTVLTNFKSPPYNSIQPGYDYTVKTAPTSMIGKNIILAIANDPSCSKYRIIAFDNNTNVIYKSGLNTGVQVSQVGHTTAGGSVGILKSAASANSNAKVDFI